LHEVVFGMEKFPISTALAPNLKFFFGRAAYAELRVVIAGKIVVFAIPDCYWSGQNSY